MKYVIMYKGARALVFRSWGWDKDIFVEDFAKARRFDTIRQALDDPEYEYQTDQIVTEEDAALVLTLHNL